MREHCYEVNAVLMSPTPAYGFAVLSTVSTIQPVELRSTAVEPAHVAAVAKLLAEVAHVQVTPVIERAYLIDLDGDGERELVLQSTHPDLHGDPPDYKPEYYSLIVVLGGGPPAFTGYIQASESHRHFEVLTLDAVADLDFDGKLELLNRARHSEGWQTRVLRYRGGELTELFRSVGGEGQCSEVNE